MKVSVVGVIWVAAVGLEASRMPKENEANDSVPEETEHHQSSAPGVSLWGWSVPGSGTLCRMLADMKGEDSASLNSSGDLDEQVVKQPDCDTMSIDFISLPESDNLKPQVVVIELEPIDPVPASGQPGSELAEDAITKVSSQSLALEAETDAAVPDIPALVDSNSYPSALEELSRQVVYDSLSWKKELISAWRCGDVEYVAALMQTDLYGDFMTPKALNMALVRACENGNVGIVSMLLKLDAQGQYIYRDINPAFNRYMGLEMACTNNHLPVVELLLKKCDGRFVLPGMEGVPLRQMALDVANSCQHAEIVAFLLQRDSQDQALFPELDQ